MQIQPEEKDFACPSPFPAPLFRETHEPIHGACSNARLAAEACRQGWRIISTQAGNRVRASYHIMLGESLIYGT